MPKPRVGQLTLVSLVTLMLVTVSSYAQDTPPAAPHQTTRHGFIRDWLKLGPISYGRAEGDPMQGRPINYDKLQKAGLLDPTWHDFLGGDWKAAPNAGETAQVRVPGGQESSMRWEAMHAPADRIDLDRRNGDYELNYLVTYLWSPREMTDAAFYVGSDDFVEVFVNGRCVHVYKAERRGLLPPDEVRNVHLRRGWNVINAKVVDVTHGYEFCLAVVDDTGTPMRGMPVTLRRPEGLSFVDEQTMRTSKVEMHEKGQEKVPPEIAYFDAGAAVGADYPLRIDFTHNARLAAESRQQPLAMATAGRDPAIVASYSIAVYDPRDLSQRKYPPRQGTNVADIPVIAPPAKVRIVAELLERSARQDPAANPLKDRVVDREETIAELNGGRFQGKSFTIPTDQIGYFAIEVSVYDGEKLVRYDDYPFAVVSPPDYQPVKFTDPLPASAQQWQEGDWQRWRQVVDNREEPRKLKFWPTLPYGAGEFVTPVPSNLLEGDIGLGHITPTPDAAPTAITYVREDWTEDTRVYRFGSVQGNLRMEYAKSKVSAAAWVRTNHNQLTLFEGLDSVNLGQPSFLAYRSAGGIRVVPASVLLSPGGHRPDMAAPWLLFWFAGSENWKALDIPVVVVLQRRPATIEQNAGGTTIRFAGEAGVLTAMPLYGARIIHPQQTSQWASALPADVAAECDFWSRAMRNYPRSGKDRFRVVGPDVQVRLDYEYLSSEDDWGTAGVKFAPLPHWVGLAAEHPQSVVELPPGTHKTRQLNQAGPTYGVIGDGSASYTLRDMTRYVQEVRVVTDVRRDGPLARAWEDLAYMSGEGRRNALSSMPNMAGPGYPDSNFTYHRVLLRHDGGYRFGQHCFENENTMIANVSHSLAYIPPDDAQKLKALMMRFMDIGMLLERWQGFNDQRLMFEDVQWFISRFMAGSWSYGHFTGDWRMMRDRFPLVKVEFASLAKEVDWDRMRSCGSEESNLLYQGAIGYARTARVAGDIPEHLYGMYYATRHLALQQTLWMTIDNDGYQRECWFGYNRYAIRMDDATARPRRPALFYWWLMSNPVYDAKDPSADWHAGVLSPFTYPYFPEIMRFHTERNEPLIKYYLAQWEANYPDWYKGSRGGWDEYFGPPEFFASRGWMCDYTGETAEEMMAKYLQNFWGINGPQKGKYEFQNRGWTSLPKAMIAIIEASGKRQWVKHY